MEGGALEPVNIYSGHRERQAQLLAELISDFPQGLTKNELERKTSDQAKEVRKSMKAVFPKITAKDLVPSAFKAYEMGMLDRETKPNSRGSSIRYLPFGHSQKDS